MNESTQWWHLIGQESERVVQGDRQKNIRRRFLACTPWSPILLLSARIKLHVNIISYMTVIT